MPMEYKHQNTNFRYIIRNGDMDNKVLIKRFSEGLNLPYRNLSLDILGAISPIKPRTKPNAEKAERESSQNETEDQFTSPSRRGSRENYILKETILRNIT